MSLRNLSYTETVVMVTETRGNCSILFGLTEEFRNKRQSDGQSFYCPNGHRIAYSDTEVSRLKKQLKKKEEEREE